MAKFVGDRETAYVKSQNEVVWSRLYIMLHNLVGQLFLTGLFYRCPPYGFMALLHHDAAERAAKLQEFRLWWEAYEVLENEAKVDRDCNAFLSDLLCVRSQFSLEVMVRLREVGFNRIPPDLRVDLQAFARSFGSSLVCEEFFREVKEMAKESVGKRMDPATMYHAAASASKALSNFGREPMKVAAAARAAAHKNTLPSDFFDYDAGKFSLGMDALDGVMASKASWPTMSPARIVVVGASVRVFRLPFLSGSLPMCGSHPPYMCMSLFAR